MISNTDDHLRNHGFLYEPYKGRELSPIYDVNPTPIDIKPRILTTTIDLDDGTTFPGIGLTQNEAEKKVKEVVKSVAGWKEQAKNFHIRPSEISRISSAFDHSELKKAWSF